MFVFNSKGQRHATMLFTTIPFNLSQAVCKKRVVIKEIHDNKTIIVKYSRYLLTFQFFDHFFATGRFARSVSAKWNSRRVARRVQTSSGRKLVRDHLVSGSYNSTILVPSYAAIPEVYVGVQVTITA